MNIQISKGVFLNSGHIQKCTCTSFWFKLHYDCSMKLYIAFVPVSTVLMSGADLKHLIE